MIPPIVSLEFLTKNPEAILVDCRWYLNGKNAKEAYLAGHIPGAIFIDLDTVLAAPAKLGKGRHPLPTPSDFAERMGNLGISNTAQVIFYDDCGGTVAARGVWMLRAQGCDAALLDGGLNSYLGDLEVGEIKLEPTVFQAQPWPDTVVDLVYVAKAIGISTADIAEISASEDFSVPPARSTLSGSAPILLDARPLKRFRGEIEPVDSRPGHIPGAKSASCSENLDSSGRFLSVELLRQRFLDLGLPLAQSEVIPEIISYCGSGVTACHNILALESLGFKNIKLYPGSWSQWSAYPQLPAELG